MEVPDIIIELIKRFQFNEKQYKSGSYNETQVRLEFINPLFKALGWDVDNEQGHAEAYKDVIHEDKIKVGLATKAPDYSFRIGGQRKFFLEAKKPSVNIKEDIHPAYQLRRYAWSAKLPLSILTDFEEFAVYDCRIKPNKTDKASNARIMYFNYKDYIEKWDEIASVFSKDAILKGSFDKFAESSKKKKGTAEVDSAFLNEMELWRELLAKNIALRNKNLSTRALNEAVQKTIDRIVFLRICEDRGIENYGQIQKMLNVNNVYSHLRQIFLRADDKYNSGLFHFKKDKNNDDYDNWSLDLQIDDKVLNDIIRRLYYPDSPYEFSVLPADILGHVYERFLGKVIRLTAGHQAKVEEKPEVRKAGGVYYTPTYIVDYIVKNTVGKLLEKRTLKKAETLRILDPACGSGSFLLGAFDYLMKWHFEKYSKNPKKYAKGKQARIYEVSKNEYKLTTNEKKRILLSNIYGVDIDSQAVEVTKLSLLLKVLEDETKETLGIIKQYQMKFTERALPDLSNNIKCGNSLIGSDYYKGRDVSMFDEEEMYKINAFDWEEEFPEVFVGSSDNKSSKANQQNNKTNSENLKPYHLTWATYNSRVNKRMIDYESVIHYRRKAKGLPPVLPPRILSTAEELFIAKSIKNICEKYGYRILGMNICKDHIHIAIVCDEKDLSNIVRTIKSISARELNIYNEHSVSYKSDEKWEAHGLADSGKNGAHGLARVKEDNTINEDGNDKMINDGGDDIKSNGASPTASVTTASVEEKEAHGLARVKDDDKHRGYTQTHLWQRKFNSSLIKSDKELYNVLNYIQNNRIKHELQENEELKSVINSFLIPISNAFESQVKNDKSNDNKSYNGGFDAVIGNPPYVDFRILDKNSLKYLVKNYNSTLVKEKWNLYIPFIELGSYLLNSKGVFGYIVPNAFLVSDFGIMLRKLLLNKTKILKLIDVSKLKVFGSVAIYPILIFFQNEKNESNFIEIKYPQNISELNDNNSELIKQSLLNNSENNYLISTSFSSQKIHFFTKIEKKSNPLSNYYDKFIWGTSITGFKNHKLSESEYLKLKKKDKNKFCKVIQTSNIKRYYIEWKGEYIEKDIYSFNAINEFLKNKIVIARVTKKIQAAYDKNNYFVGKSSLLTVIKIEPYFLLGLLNSKLINYIYSVKFENTHMSGGYLRYDIPYLKSIPIINIDFSNKHEKAQHDKMVELVDRMLELNKRVHFEGISTQEKKILEQQISLTDKEIDRLVYELYGLTEEEIKIVEES